MLEKRLGFFLQKIMVYFCVQLFIHFAALTEFLYEKAHLASSPAQSHTHTHTYIQCIYI